MRGFKVGGGLGVGLLGAALAACQVLSGVTDLVIDDVATAPDVDGAVDASFDATVDAESVDAGSTLLTIVVDRPEVNYLTTAGEIDAIEVDGVEACSGEACRQDLKVRVPRKSVTIAVRAAAPSSVHFLAPSSCKTTGTSCAITVGVEAAAVTVRAVRHNYVFVTRDTHLPNFGNLEAADARCATAASDEGLPGTYVAWLSDAATNATAAARVGAAGGFVRMDGRPFADTVGELNSGQVFYPIQLDPGGVQVDRGALVFTGTYGLGTFGGNNCSDWLQSNNRYAAVGYAFGGAGEWTNIDRVLDCASTARLYCFRNDRAVPLEILPPPALHRIAFLSTAFKPTGGRPELDTRCQNDAVAAGIASGGRVYRAWVATSDRAPQDSMDTSAAKGGWYRIDGLPVFPDPTILRRNNGDAIAPEAPIAQRADGSYVTDVPVRDTYVWTGMNNGPREMATGPGFTCDDWTTTTSTSYGRAGNAGFGNPLAFGQPPVRDMRATNVGGADQPCSRAHSVYCLEN